MKNKKTHHNQVSSIIFDMTRDENQSKRIRIADARIYGFSAAGASPFSFVDNRKKENKMCFV
ncbi:hypothetical protein GBA52_016567 [Prunus armeniaca]|nr:hypothetical protein GBA52_016567 [Prunus armeniaca]